MEPYRILEVDVGGRTWRLREFPLTKVLGPVDAGILVHFERRTWEKSAFDPDNALLLGSGPFKGGRLMGTHRLIAVFKSPQTGTLHVSAVGGASYAFMRTGVDAVVIVGRSHVPLIMTIIGDRGETPRVEFHEISYGKLEDLYRGYSGKRGIYAFTSYLIDNYWELFENYMARPVLVGPAAVRTIFGAIFAPGIDLRRRDVAYGQEDSAARGGGGTVMYRSHNVSAIIFGGKSTRSAGTVNNSDAINKVFRSVYGKDYVSVLNEKTVKYRYDPKLRTGGTFGVNYVHYRELVPGFAYNTVYASKTLRIELSNLILEKFWKPFNVEVFEKSKSWYNCGEPCSVVCKKVWRGKKVDYEPFNALGPLIGVVRFEDSVELVDLADEKGLDAIEVGHIVAWIFDLIHKGLLEPGEVGLDSKPMFDPSLYSPSSSTMNARLAKALIEGLTEGSNEVLRLIAENGIRGAAKALNAKYKDRVSRIGIGFEDTAVYIPLGDGGYMTPNLYWTPGMLAPLFMLGRYWTDYNPTFADPEEYARSSMKRALNEYLIDNAGICRFHRGWAESALRDMYRDLLGVDVDIREHALRAYRQIAEYSKMAGAEPRMWEGKKPRDIIFMLAGEVGSEEWAAKFARDPEQASSEWWTRFYDEVNRELGLVLVAETKH